MLQKIHPKGNMFSRISWGTWQIPEEIYNSKAVAERLEVCLDNKITTIDCADIYGGYKTEQVLGDALKILGAKREEYQIVTKCDIFNNHPDYPEIQGHHYDSSYEYVKQAINRSLEKLQTPYIDLLLLHRLDYLLDPKDCAKALMEFYNKGLIKAVGVSNFPTWQVAALQKFLEIPIVTNQVEFSLLHLDPLDDGVLAQAIEYDFSPMYWSPFARGDIFKNAQIMASLSKFAKIYGVSEAVIATAWLLKHPARGIVVLGSNNKERIKEYSSAVAINLKNNEWYEILKSTGKILP